MQVIPGKSVTKRPAIDKSGFLTNVAASCNRLMIFRNASYTALIKLYMQVMVAKQAWSYLQQTNTTTSKMND
jgi:hypothetical protein